MQSRTLLAALADRDLSADERLALFVGAIAGSAVGAGAVALAISAHLFAGH